MSTLQLTNSTNSTYTTGVYFAGASLTTYIAPWSLDPQTKILEEKNTLFQDLSELLTTGSVFWNASPTIPKPNYHINAELASIKAELAKRRAAGAFVNNVSLANRYAKYGVSYSDEEIQATLREIRSQWEQDIDDLYDQD